MTLLALLGAVGAGVIAGNLSVVHADSTSSSSGRPGGTGTGDATQAASSQPATQKTAEQKREEEIARVMEFFRIAQPDTYDQARSLRDTDPTRFYKMIHDASSMVNKLEQLKRRNPSLFELRMKDFELAYKTVRLGTDIQKIPNPNDRGPEMRELSQMVSDQFDLRQKIRQMEIDDLRKQLSDLEDDLKKRSDDKESLIKKRMDDLLMSSPPNQW